MDTNDLANSITAVNQLMKQNSAPTGLTHDQNNLFVSYEDEAKTSDVQLNPAASSLTLVGQGGRAFQMLIRQVPRNDLSSQPTIEVW